MTIPVSVPSGDAGLPLEALLVDTAGTPVGSAITTGFAMDGSTGTWTGTVPDGFSGAIRIRRQSDHVTRMTYALDGTVVSGLSSDDARKLDEIYKNVQS